MAEVAAADSEEMEERVLPTEVEAAAGIVVLVAILTVAMEQEGELQMEAREMVRVLEPEGAQRSLERAEEIQMQEQVRA
ncbi:MAG TPA: hypothetical protein VGG02_00165 [Chthoniobacterales bacterium]|jgi:hypothetical protein